MTLMERRRALMAGKKSGPRLPAEYQEVEWVGVALNATNTGYGTPIDMTDVSRVEMKLAVDTAPSNECIVIASLSAGRFTYPYGGLNSGGWFQCSPNLPIGSAATETVYTLTKTGSVQQYPIALLGYNRAEYVAATKMNWVKIYDSNDELLFDGVPAYEKSSGKIGIYDTVTSTFINGNGNNRTKGADV